METNINSKFYVLNKDTILELQTESLQQALNNYYKLRLKYSTANKNIFFNKTCLSKNLTPRYVQIKIKTKSSLASKIIEKSTKNWVRLELNKWYNIRDTLKLYLYNTHTRLTNLLHPCEFDTVDSQVRDRIDSIMKIKTDKINKKLQNLEKHRNQQKEKNFKNNPTNPKFQFNDRIKNYSNTVFTETEKNVLNKGLKHCVEKPIRQNEIEDIAINMAASLIKNRENDTNKTICAKILGQEIEKNRNKINYSENKTIKSLKSKIKENNLTVVKSDKGNSIVILDQKIYKEKTETFLKTQNFNQIKNPVNKYNKLVRDKIKNSKILNEKTKMSLIEKNPKCPRLYSLPKIHKSEKLDEIPIRPVVSYSGACVTKLAKSLNKIFKEKTNFQPDHSILNSLDLINKIKNIDIPNNAKLISLDIISLFTNVPPSETKDLVDQIIYTCPNLNIKEKTDLSDLMELCLNHNFFQYNDKFYEQKNGLAIGNPLSPLFAEIFLKHFEKQFLNIKCEFSQYIKYYYRYVDDVIVLWTGTERILNKFIKHINSLHEKIKFTVEKEKEKTLNYLDLKIKIEENKHTFEIYRKDTSTDTVIHNMACRPMSHKLAAFHSMIHRLNSIPLKKEHFLTELEIIKEIAINNGYESNLIDQILKGKIQKSNLNLIYSQNSQINDLPKLILPYYGKMSEKIKHKLKSLGYATIFRSPYTLGSELSQIKDKIPENEKSGVYKLTCQDCNATYIGKTERNLSIRINEHKRAYKLKYENYAFAEHLNANNHSFPDQSKIKLIKEVNDPLILSLKESIEILKSLEKSPIESLNEKLEIINDPFLKTFHSFR